MDVFELLAQSRPRPWWKQRLIAVVWVVAGLAALAAMTWIVLLANGAATGGSGVRPSFFGGLREFLTEGWQRVGVLLIFVGTVSGGLAIFYRSAVVHPPGIRRRVWAGTLVALTL